MSKQPLFVIGICALHFIRTVENYQHAMTVNGAAYSLVVEITIHIKRSVAPRRETLGHTNYGPTVKLIQTTRGGQMQ